MEPTTMDVLKKSTKNFLRKSANKLKKFRPKTKEELQKLVDSFINLGDIDTSLINDMSYLFSNTKRTDFSGIENWDVSNVTNMNDMFYGATNFNQPLDNWDVSSVTNMSGMFAGATNFNKPLNSWDVSNVRNMSAMFAKAAKFNQPLNNWDVLNVTNMRMMFENAEKFNQPLDSWDVSIVTDMSEIFKNSAQDPLPKWYNNCSAMSNKSCKWA